MNKNIFDFFKRYDFSFWIIATLIFIVGVFNLYSATHASTSEAMASIYKNQVLKYLLGFGVGFVISLLQPKNFYQYSSFFYYLILFVLLLVLVLGDIGMGAQRWIALGPVRFQPSEFAKIAVVLMLARWFSRNFSDQRLGLKELVFPTIITFVPAVLIIMQPDLGTGLLVVLIFSLMAFFRQLKWKSIGLISIFAILSGILMYNFGLKEYQKKRIVTFLNPSADARGSGYNAIQSKIAIGSGRLVGKGFKNSSQASLNYLPENHTDFVFSIFNEEHGFLGSIFLIALYLLLMFRFLWLANNASRIYESLVVIGIMAIFFWHTFINMSMVTGLMPIVGLPLPLMSYGGSSLLTFCIGIGIVTSISNRRNFF